MEAKLKEFFGYSSFRPFQKEIIEQVLKKKDCLVIMATGSGKSICYQLPPLVSKKMGVVISPLISLMQDQVIALKQHGIRVEFLGSAQTDTTVHLRAQKGEFDLLYMTPEKACSLTSRTEYKQLHSLRAMLPGVPFVALTATATQKVREDIRSSLHLQNAYTVISSFDRPNIFYGVKALTRSSCFREELAQEVQKDIQGGGSTIIYCTTIKDVEEVVDAFMKTGLNAKAYHGKMNFKERESIHRAFLRDELQVVVATVAFGMGIDKPDIRRVIHYGCPKSLESYYQESGRCGRDGLPSTCWLYYTRGDFTKADFYVGEVRTEARRQAVVAAYLAAQKYCTTTSCRRACVLEYFGENSKSLNCGKCDNCTRPGGPQERDLSKEVHLLLAAVQSSGGRWGLNMPIDVLRGSLAKKVVENGYDKLSIFGLGRYKSPTWWKALGDQMLMLGYLKDIIRNTFRIISVGAMGEKFLRSSIGIGCAPLLIPMTQEMIEEENNKDAGISGANSNSEAPTILTHLHMQGFSEAELTLYKMLVEARASLARRNSTAPYTICDEVTLQRLAKIRPSTAVRLCNIDGVNEWLVAHHGEEIIANIRRLSQEVDLPLDSIDKTVLRLPGSTSAVKGDFTKVTPAKIEAWRMWQEENKSIYEIANLPDRPKPIKEDTVVEYIFDCIRAGYEIDWDRFCRETDYAMEVANEIKVAVQKTGSKELLKPIKENLPESVSYRHIKMYLLMEDLNIPFPKASSTGATQCASQEASILPNPTSLEDVKPEVIGSRQFQPQSSNISSVENKETMTAPPWMPEEARKSSIGQGRRAPSWMSKSSNEQGSKKVRHEKPDTQCEEVDVASHKKPLDEVTDEALLQWISTTDGVSIKEIASRFSGTSIDRLHEILRQLEADFSIYQKCDLYRVM
ncbi:hypothetical protein O6H91_23G029400 [Diphasiastrum complanatum]|uniref:Uncharacterized protein n=1 Tax=Diphasiastrum complanatum TaxID=34168 RepID=A0ACC2A9D7_DIPCM|nr:hypothetical protein O6H91_23G029400 [Diphasiastrum complanatum]